MSVLFRGEAVAHGRNLSEGNSSDLDFLDEKEGFVERLVKIVEAP